MSPHRLLIIKDRIKMIGITIFLLHMLVVIPLGHAQSSHSELESSYRFLVSNRDTADGILYMATAGKLKGRFLPLSFTDSPEYWGEYVCRLPGNTCIVTDVYDPQTYSLTPQKSIPGDLQTERINTHNGTNIYDAATWQIAVMLGHVLNRFPLPNNQDAYALVRNQNSLLRAGYNGNSSQSILSENRAITVNKVFLYNHQVITEPKQAYAFRMLPRNWLSPDPFMGTQYADQIKTSNLPTQNPAYQPGMVTWSDWKPITGENAWAFLLGPLQAAYIHYVIGQKSAFVPLQDLAVQNALDILPTFAAMQSPSGALYYAPTGTVANQGDQLVDPYAVSVENNFSLYAGLKILHATLQATITHEKNLNAKDTAKTNEALQLINAMINGGMIGQHRTTSGLLTFFRELAWHDGEFVQGGRADDPNSTGKWLPSLLPKAVDVNTWGVSALGPQQIDAWFGFGAAYQNWQQVKQWGGYGIGRTLWGVGFSDQDGNGIDGSGNYRQGILSTEWTAGAITMLRSMISYYQTIPSESSYYGKARHFLEQLKLDEQSMLAAIEKMRIDIYATAGFPGQPPNFLQLLPPRQTSPYMYASKRYLIPFGWYANPIPSTCSTAWIIMVLDSYNPFAYGGKY
ncbi:MAG: hypothetical protein KKD01_09255 [Proteobacteria bacterium]|nr:hypothetical protein [Pseudomonadota bacterium]MBU1454897.1 hypothetical protein [Pseudomonadota bacterium]